MTNEVKNVPELRFPEFDEEWEKKVLGEISNRVKRKNTNSVSKMPLTISGSLGLVDQITYFSKSVSAKNLDNYTLIKNGEFAYNKSYSNGYPLGAIKRLERYDQGALSTLYICFKFNDSQSSEFMKHYFESDKWYKEVSQIAVEGARNHGLLNIPVNDFFSINLFTTMLTEQQKIGEFFSKLDRQIELEEQKLAKLEEQKKGYMQKIFSQELGFKDENGNEYPTWQSYKLGNLYKKGKAGGTPKSTESKYYNGEVPFLSISDITEQGKFIMNTEKSITQEGVDNSTAWLVPVNSINYAMYASVGYLSINKIEVATSQAIFNMVFEDNNLVEYIYYYLNHIRDKGILEKLVGTGTQSNLSASIMKSMYIKLPDYEEMVKITDFLSKVDKLIEKQNQKIDGLKERKKGFLQKMFV